jgi:hypothetical protein
MQNLLQVDFGSDGIFTTAHAAGRFGEAHLGRTDMDVDRQPANSLPNLFQPLILVVDDAHHLFTV